MSRLALGVFAAGCLASLALADSAFGQRCGPGGGQGPQPGFGMQGPMQPGFAPQGTWQPGIQQQSAQSAAQLGAVQQACSQIAATRQQERVQQAAYRAMMTELNRERFRKVAEAEQKRRNAIRQRNRLRSLEQNAEKQHEQVVELTVEP